MKIERAYIIALTIIAVAITISELISQEFIKNRSVDSTIVNISGRQRMLSQKIAKSAILLVNARDSATFYQSQSELSAAINLWSKSHHALQYGDPTLGIETTQNSPEILSLFEKANPRFEVIFGSAEDLVNGVTYESLGEPQWIAFLDHILENEDEFLLLMDQITFQYDKEAHERVNGLSTLELWLYIIAMVLLLLEALFIFRPALKQLRANTSKLVESERKLEQARVEKRYTKALEAKNKELSQFVYITSHDLIEPLNSIISFSKLMTRSVERLDEIQLKSIEVIQQSGYRMRDFIISILEHTRIGHQKNRTEVLLSELINHLQTDLHSLIEEKQASIKFLGADLRFMAFEVDLVKLFQNLIVNAIKYSREGVKPDIVIKAEEQEMVYLVSIADNGIGIEEEYFDKIFEVFRRLHNRDEYSGTGIGLAHCKKIVELHEGEIWLESEAGKGSTFYFTIKKWKP